MPVLRVVVVTVNEQPRRYLYDKNGRDRVRVKRCPDCRAVVRESAETLACPECGWDSVRERVAR